MDDIIIKKGGHLETKNNDELRQICRENKLKGFSNCKNKKDLIRFILDNNSIIEKNIEDKIEDESKLESRDNTEDDVEFVDSDDSDDSDSDSEEEEEVEEVEEPKKSKVRKAKTNK